jgi:hypothetical protein
MYLEAYINEALKSVKANKYSNAAFLERLSVASKLLKGVQTETRTVKAPFFLNDLGVRYSDGPKEFAEWNSKQIEVALPSHKQIVNDLENWSVTKLADVFDACVLLTGDYAAVMEVALSRKDDIINNGSISALTYSGSACAALGNKAAYTFFDRAINISKSNKDTITNIHRLIVTKLKRFKDFSGAEKLMNRLVSVEIKNSNYKKVYMGLFDNILGLGEIMEKSPLSWISAKTNLLNAKDSIEEYLTYSSDLDMVSQAFRYRGQVELNLVQLEIMKGNLSSAKILAQNNVRYVRKNATEYLPEAVSTLAYLEYLNKDYNKSISTTKEAINLHAEIGNLDGIIAGRETLIGNYTKLKRKSEAINEARLIKSKSFEIESLN